MQKKTKKHDYFSPSGRGLPTLPGTTKWSKSVDFEWARLLTKEARDEKKKAPAGDVISRCIE
jgi:hypothetical protein